MRPNSPSSESSPMPTQLATPIQASLDRLCADVSSARDELFAAARSNLLAMTRRQLLHFARLRRWEESDDIVQVAPLKIDEVLGAISARHDPRVPRPFRHADPARTH